MAMTYISSLPPLEAINTTPELSICVSTNNNPTWLKVKNDLSKCFDSKVSKHVIKAWFDKLEVSEDLVNKKLILTGTSFFIDYIFQNFGMKLENVAKKNKINIELRYSCNTIRPILLKG